LKKEIIVASIIALIIIIAVLAGTALQWKNQEGNIETPSESPEVIEIPVGYLSKLAYSVAIYEIVCHKESRYLTEEQQRDVKEFYELMGKTIRTEGIIQDLYQSQINLGIAMLNSPTDLKVHIPENLEQKVRDLKLKCGDTITIEGEITGYSYDIEIGGICYWVNFKLFRIVGIQRR
jgi:hypothetical protein